MNEVNFKLGALSSPVDERDYTYDMVAQSSTSAVTLPSSFSLNYQFTPKNQGQVGSCVAHSISEMDEIIRAMDEQLSPGYIYQNRLETDWHESGMIPREALSQLVKCGICTQKLFPVNEEYPQIKETFSKYDTAKINADALTRKSLSFIKLNLEDVKKYIYNEKKPVLFTINVYDSFYNTVNGFVPQAAGNKIGGHAMLIIGWRADEFVVLNHWGTWGGANGFLYIPYNFNQFKEFWSVTDKPIIKPVSPTPNPNSPIIKPTATTTYKVLSNFFKTAEEANVLRSRLQKVGITSTLSLYPNAYKVQLGVFKDESNAKNLLKKVIDLGFNEFSVSIVI